MFPELENLIKAYNSKNTKEDPNLVRNCQQILRKTNENATGRNFLLDFVSFL